MTWMLMKCSAPGWDKEFPTKDEAIDELRKHVCGDCLRGSPGFLDDIVDVETDGSVIECRDASALLSTPCGCEFDLEETP